MAKFGWLSIEAELACMAKFLDTHIITQVLWASTLDAQVCMAKFFRGPSLQCQIMWHAQRNDLFLQLRNNLTLLGKSETLKKKSNHNTTHYLEKNCIPSKIFNHNMCSIILHKEVNFSH